jgi:oligoribonuclease NrnB/cAMP/cGMP phosphodiesterase (DHH superfamily)
MQQQQLLKPILVCYHSNCTDGFTAALCAYMKLIDNADYFPVQYGKEYDLQIFRDKVVYILDFSFSREFCEQINDVAESLLIIDHHATARDALEGLPYAKFDMTKSGALLAWEHFHSKPNVPLFIQYVSNYDLWNHADPNVMFFNKFIRSHEMDFKTWWEILVTMQDAEGLDFISEGKAIDRYVKQQVKSNTSHAFKCIIAGHEGKIVNCSTVFSSEVGHEITKETGTYGATYTILKDGTVVVSLRSVGEYKVNDIAKLFGGGGHNNAAGFNVPLSKLQFQNNSLIIEV